MAREHVVEHDPVGAAGGRHSGGGPANDDAAIISPDGDDQRAAGRGGTLPQATKASGEGAKGDEEQERSAPATKVALVERDTGGTAGGQRDGEAMPKSDVKAPAGKEERAQEENEDEDSGQDSGSLGTGLGGDESEHEDAASEASCSTDCSQPRRRIPPAGRTALGKRDSGQRGPVQEHSPKRRCTGGAAAADEQMYIDVGLPGGPDEDGAPHRGYVVTAPQRGN